MLLSSRAQPPRPLRDLQPTLRSTLSVKQFLLHSPLPSPALPALVPRHGKKPPPFNSRRALRILTWLAILATVYSLASTTLQWSQGSANRRLPALPYLTSSGKASQISVDDELPDYPTPVGVVDRKGRKKWTISIPEKLGFPLKPADYADICSRIPEVANHISQKPQSSTFLDVAEAQKQGLLPPARPDTKTHSLPVCARSLTYVLDATDAGFGSALMGLWVSYGLAKQESRAFFIDDTHFAYGRYTSFFRSTAAPFCRPPPPSQRLPCPSQARHLIISAATVPWSFGADFQSGHSTAEIFNLARQGYKALFHLRSDDASYVSERIDELRGNDPEDQNKIIGIHLRRGDRRPFTLAYSRAYIPPSMYVSAANDLAQHITSSESSGPATAILATDDPELYNPRFAPALSSIPRAQSRIVLGSKSSLSASSSLSNNKNQQPAAKPGSIGWEGGFFPALFFSLGLPPEVEWQKRINSPLPSRMVAELGEDSRIQRDYRTEPTHEAERMRGLIGRAWLLDLAVLGRAGEEGGVVCAVSSFTCRLLGVMLGDEGGAVVGSGGDGTWRNVEVGYPWRAFDV